MGRIKSEKRMGEKGGGLTLSTTNATRQSNARSWGIIKAKPVGIEKESLFL